MLNVLVLGVVGFLVGSNEPDSHVVSRIAIPVLAEIPLLGPALFDQPWVLYLVYPVVPLIWFLLYRTRWGLEVRAVGEDPNASDVSGLHVNKRRRQTIYLTGILAGIGGGYFLSPGRAGSRTRSSAGAATSPSPRSSSADGR